VKYIASLTSEQAPENQKQIERAEAVAAPVERPPLKPDATVDFFGSPISGSYFRDLCNYDSAKVAAGLKIPILFLQGGRDYQVTNANFDIWKKELATIRGRRSSSIHRIGAAQRRRRIRPAEAAGLCPSRQRRSRRD
jgi:hypothetical protein